MLPNIFGGRVVQLCNSSTGASHLRAFKFELKLRFRQTWREPHSSLVPKKSQTLLHCESPEILIQYGMYRLYFLDGDARRAKLSMNLVFSSHSTSSKSSTCGPA